MARTQRLDLRAVGAWGFAKKPLKMADARVALCAASRERVHVGGTAVYAGLHQSDRFLFPAQFETDFLRTSGAVGSGRAFNLHVRGPRSRIEGVDVEEVDFSGFSWRAEKGMAIEREIGCPLAESMALFMFLPRGGELPPLPRPPYALREVNRCLAAYRNILELIGLRSESEHEQFRYRDEYDRSFAFPFTMSHAMNLFRMAYSWHRRALLEELIETACELSYAPAVAESINWRVSLNLGARRGLNPYDFTRDAAVLEALDLDLRIFLVQKIAQLRGVIPGGIIEVTDEHDWQRLDLFMLGYCYLSTMRYFLEFTRQAVGAGMVIVEGDILQNSFLYHAFRTELDCMKAALRGEESLGGIEIPGDGVDMMITAKDHLAYHGARILEAFAGISGANTSLIDLPIPFDLFPVIDAHYSIDE